MNVKKLLQDPNANLILERWNCENGHLWQRNIYDSICIKCRIVRKRKNPYHWFFKLDEEIGNAKTIDELATIKNRIEKRSIDMDTKWFLLRWIGERLEAIR